MAEEEKEYDEMNIRETDILEDPFAEENGMIDLLLVDDPAPKITDSVKEIGDVVEARNYQTPSPIIQEPDYVPIINDASAVMNVNLRKNAALQKFVGNPVDNDNLVSAIRENKPSHTLFNAVMEEIAEEAAYIKAWRNQHWDNDADLSDATYKRIRMLKHLVETLVEKEKLRKEDNVGKIDFHGEAFQRVLKYFLEAIQRTFKKISIPIQYEDIFFTELAKEFDGFEKNAEKLYYGKDLT